MVFSIETGQKRGEGVAYLNAREHLCIAGELHVCLAKWHKSFDGDGRGIAGVTHGRALVIDDEALAWQQAHVAAYAEDSKGEDLRAFWAHICVICSLFFL